MPFDPMFRQFLIAGGKQSLEESGNDADDHYIPTLVVDRGGQYEVLVLIGAHPFVMLQAVLPTLREMQPDVLGFTTDSYMASGEAVDLLPRRDKYNGSLAAMFEAGEPGVFEALIIHIASKGETEVIELPYTRTDNGIVWNDFDHPNKVHEGRIIDVLQAVWS